MANRLMSAYGNVAKARTDIGRNLSDIAGIGIEMEYGSEGRIAGEMAQRDIVNKTAAIGLGLETIQQVAGLGVGYEKETEAAESVGGKEIYKKNVKDAATGEWRTEYGDKGNLFQKLGRFLGFSERDFNVEGKRYTGAQIEAAVPYTKIGKTWAEASGLTGGGYDFTQFSNVVKDKNNTYKDPEIKERIVKKGGSKLGPYWEGGVEERDADGNVISTLYEAASSGDTTIYEMPSNSSDNTSVTTSPSKYANMTFGEYLKDPNVDQSLVNQLMSGGWGSAIKQWEEARKTL